MVGATQVPLEILVLQLKQPISGFNSLLLNRDRDYSIGFKQFKRIGVIMEVPKFIVGVLTIAIGLWLAGNLGAALFKVGREAERASIQHHQFKLGDFNRKLNK